jgi:hypothetical protein
LNVTPGTNCFICVGAGQGKDIGSLLGNVRNNTLNVRCAIDVDVACSLFGGMTSSGTVSRNTVNVYGDGSSTTTEAMVGGGCVFYSGCAEKNTVNIYKDFSCKEVVGGLVNTGSSSFNTVNVFSKLNIVSHIYGGEVDGDGISMNNIVNIYGSITTQGNVGINGANVIGDGSSNDNRVNISGNIQSD